MRPTLILAGALLLLHPAAAPAQTVWDMPTEYPQSAMPGLGVTTFAKRLAELTAGKLQIRPSFDAAAGIRSADMLAAIAAGRVQAGDARAIYCQGSQLSGADLATFSPKDSIDAQDRYNTYIGCKVL